MSKDNLVDAEQRELVTDALTVFTNYVNQPLFINPDGKASPEELNSCMKRVEDYFGEFGDIYVLSDVRPQEDIYMLFTAYDGDDGGPVTIFATWDNYEGAILQYLTYEFDTIWSECYRINYRTGKGAIINPNETALTPEQQAINEAYIPGATA